MSHVELEQQSVMTVKCHGAILRIFLALNVAEEITIICSC